MPGTAVHTYGTRLKAVRKAEEYTQARFGELVGVSAKTVSEWETGKKEPCSKQWCDLALALGTCIDDLKGKTVFTPKVMTNEPHDFVDPEVFDGYWENMGLLLPGREHSVWYPLPNFSATWTETALGDPARKWMVAYTLNNRILIINLAEVRQVNMLPDASDWPMEDWVHGWDSYQGKPQEFYEGLFQYYILGIVVASDRMERKVQAIETDDRFEAESMEEFLCNTRVHFTDGSVVSISAEEEERWPRKSGQDVKLVPTLRRTTTDGQSYEEALRG